MTEPPLSDDELDALRRILLDQGGTVSREAAIELLLEALWWRGARSRGVYRHPRPLTPDSRVWKTQ